MRVPFLDIVAQHLEVKTELEASVLEILNTGAYVLGKYNKALEQDVAVLHGVDHGIAVNSGTDALRIMLQAAGIGPGDEVITTAFTFVATVEVILQLGATPVFVDIEPVTYQIDPNLIEGAITPRTKAIMPVHLFGQLCPMAHIQEIAKNHNLIILEDAAQAILSHQDGVMAGNFGIAAGLSFYVTKNLGAAGDGGMILTNDAEYADRCKSLRVHGMGRQRYYYDDIGYTSRMAELQAAVLHHKVSKLETWTAARQQVATRYSEALAGSSVIPPAILEGNNHTWHQYTVRSSMRDHLQAFLKEREIDSMIYYPVPIHFHDPYRHLANGPGSLPVTEQVSLEVLSLPVHQHMPDDHVSWVIESVLAFGKVHA
ncbi:MAG: DegT/DnrJ/EryC1/StrS family aminotransferase [Armatimonadetes bacterium]|nr:DegT/DnrJ/EryC1/StrS family aminotransferase [Armatimonadota bacterium]